MWQKKLDAKSWNRELGGLEERWWVSDVGKITQEKCQKAEQKVQGRVLGKYPTRRVWKWAVKEEGEGLGLQLVLEAMEKGVSRRPMQVLKAAEESSRKGKEKPPLDLICI